MARPMPRPEPVTMAVLLCRDRQSRNDMTEHQWKVALPHCALDLGDIVVTALGEGEYRSGRGQMFVRRKVWLEENGYTYPGRKSY